MDDFNIKIGGQSIKVRHLDHETMFAESLDAEIGDYYSGVYRCVDQEIWINDLFTGNQYLSALLHETIEAINAIYGLNLEHHAIYALSEGIAQAAAGLMEHEKN